jgi:SAM-dependent methyltransferase
MTAADPDQRSAQLTSTREFFGPRAAGWEDRFPDDDPLYAKAIAELAPAPGGVALDVACGTGRALPFLRAAVGATGTVVGVDVTAEMLATATRLGRRSSGVLVMADAVRLPFRDESHNSVFAAGLLPHVPDPPAASGSWRGSAEVEPGSHCSTRSVAPHSPTATAMSPIRTMSAPSPGFARYWRPLVGPASSSTMPPIAISSSQSGPRSPG